MTVAARTAALRDDVLARRGSFVPDANPLLCDVALWRSFEPGQSRVQRRAAFLRELVAVAPIHIGPAWTLAGEHLRPLHVGIGASHDPAHAARFAELGIDAAEAEQVRRCAGAWSGDAGAAAPRATFQVDVGLPAPGSESGKGGWGGASGMDVFWAGGWVENHSIRDFAKVLRLGFAGILAQVDAALAASALTDPDFPRQENFWRAARSVCEAGILLGARYAERAAELAAAASGVADQARLARMAAACGQVPARGARDFREAVQALWFAHILTCGEDGINANSIGRLDQILWPYYEAGLADGSLTRDTALALMEELACKLYLDYDVQAITLGGVDRDGRCAVNDLSHLILEATRNVELIRDVSVRVGQDTPPGFLRLAAELIAGGGGIPFLFNDDCFIQALTDHGIAVEDARDYAPIGCIELTIPGRANPHAVSGWFNAAKCLELALFDGVDPRTGTVLGPRTGALGDHPTFASLYAAYEAQVEFFAERMVYHCNRGELLQRERGPLPCWSVLTDDCLARGRDITDGGAVYTYHSICLLGTANVADSLLALKQVVFEQGSVGADELLAALRDDFAGREDLRQKLLKGSPKYGNDVEEVDLLAKRIDDHFIDLMDTMRSPLGGRYFVHLFSFLCHLHFGKCLGATPDGRRAGEPIAYSLSAQQGRDEHGATAMLRSLARLPHHRAAGASAAILELDPAVVAGEAGIERLCALLRAGLALGVGQLQLGVVTVERLRQAQQDPERYGSIPVRVAGFSQQFRLVAPELQEHIIARTKHRS
jgi:formate C-acetyltransferase